VTEVDFDVIWDEVDRVLGYADIPANAVTIKEVMERKGIGRCVAQRVLRELVAGSGWQTAKRAGTCYWWPGE